MPPNQQRRQTTRRNEASGEQGDRAIHPRRVGKGRHTETTRAQSAPPTSPRRPKQASGPKGLLRLPHTMIDLLGQPSVSQDSFLMKIDMMIRSCVCVLWCTRASPKFEKCSAPRPWVRNSLDPCTNQLAFSTKQCSESIFRHFSVFLRDVGVPKGRNAKRK